MEEFYDSVIFLLTSSFISFLEFEMTVLFLICERTLVFVLVFAVVADAAATTASTHFEAIALRWP